MTTPYPIRSRTSVYLSPEQDLTSAIPAASCVDVGYEEQHILVATAYIRAKLGILTIYGCDELFRDRLIKSGLLPKDGKGDLFDILSHPLGENNVFDCRKFLKILQASNEAFYLGGQEEYVLRAYQHFSVLSRNYGARYNNWHESQFSILQTSFQFNPTTLLERLEKEKNMKIARESRP